MKGKTSKLKSLICVSIFSSGGSEIFCDNLQGLEKNKADRLPTLALNALFQWY